MARILYGVSGDGMGHATRSKVVIDYLLKKNEVVVVAGDKAYDYLSRYYVNIHRIFALRLMYGNNRVKSLKTAIYNIKRFPTGKKESLEKIYRIAVEFKPEIIITDFEFFTALAAKQLKIPLICIDNNHIISRCGVEIPKREFNDYLTARIITDSIVRKADYYLLTTFFYPKERKRNTLLFPPILRENILEIKPVYGSHIFVYQTSESYAALIPLLKNIRKRFIVYGMRKNEVDSNINFRDFNENQFYEDLGHCKGIITNGGFTLISEGLSLGKPILSVPIGKQFEQICNAIYIDKLKFGEYHKKLNRETIENFINRISNYRKNLRRFKRQDNSKLFRKLDQVIEKLVKS